MSNVEVPYEGKARDKAILLLAAAEELGLDQSVVETRDGAFFVPEEVNEKAFASRVSSGNSEGEQEKKPAKRTAKKSATKSQE